MTNHFIFFLYLGSFACGISVMTFGYFLYYYKISHRALRYSLMSDLFLTTMVLLNMLGHYGHTFGFTDSLWFLLSIAYGVFFSGVGTGWYFTITVGTLLNKPVSRRLTAAYFALSGGFLLGLILLHICFSYGLFSYSAFIRHMFLTDTIFSALFVYYNAFIVWRYRSELPGEILKPVIGMSGLLVLLISASVLWDAVKYVWQTDIQLAFSPVVYFIINGIGWLVAYRYFCEFNNKIVEPDPVHVDMENIYEWLCREYGITTRELEVVVLIGEGYSNPDIGQKLFISLNTVKNHVANIFKKTGVKNRYELLTMLRGLERSNIVRNLE